ncbi:MAG: hypothetical protein J7M25_07425 [Deltaproteobacteria bacterium]|nr:hypothetical protein [Deltaproteobacteria bacterium]
MNRSKMLSPVGLPCGVATVDGKNLATLNHDAGGRAQPRSDENKKWQPKGSAKTGKPYFVAPVLRAVLTSAEARALLEPMTASEPAEAESAWEGRNGKQIRRRISRTPQMQRFQNSVGTWSHLRRNWLVRQETRNKQGSVEIEDRFFVTSLLWNYFKPIQILLLVRGHWGIENDSNNSLDLQWLEDSGPWCTQGNAVWALGLLRLMAYNVVQYLRKRRLRRKDKTGAWMSPMRWRRVFKLMRQALENAAPVPLRVFPGV